jgi:hypothetical protein
VNEPQVRALATAVFDAIPEGGRGRKSAMQPLHLIAAIKGASTCTDTILELRYLV